MSCIKKLYWAAVWLYSVFILLLFKLTCQIEWHFRYTFGRYKPPQVIKKTQKKNRSKKSSMWKGWAHRSVTQQHCKDLSFYMNFVSFSARNCLTCCSIHTLSYTRMYYWSLCWLIRLTGVFVLCTHSYWMRLVWLWCGGCAVLFD